MGGVVLAPGQRSRYWSRFVTPTKQAERTERKPDERKAGKPRTAAQGALSVSCRSGRVRSCRDPR